MSVAVSEDERAALRSALRSYLAPDGTRADERASGDLDRSRWRRLAGEMGVAGVRIPDDLGGSGLELDDELLVHEEMGRALSDLPFLSTVGFAAAALTALGDRTRLPAIAEGSLVVASMLDGAEVSAALAGDGRAVLDGAAACVADGGDADAYLVAAQTADGPVLAWVPAGSPGLHVERLVSLDLSRRFASVTVSHTEAEVLARGPAAAGALRAGCDNGYLALVSESIGLAAQALDVTVDYAKVRHQFGRPIGGFQAVKHRLADMLVELERLRSALRLAVETTAGAGAGDARRRAAIATARMLGAEVPAWIADEMIHLHGGIGYTWEHSAHLFFRRAKSNQVWLDPHSQQRREIASAVRSLYRDDKEGR